MLFDIAKKFNYILDRQQKQKILGVMLLILIGGLLETVSVSMILPLMSAILDPVQFVEQVYVKYLMNLLGMTNVDKFILFVVIMIAITFVLKNSFLIFLCYIQAKFINNNRIKVARNLLSQYLHRPYEYYLNVDTATILRTVYGDIDNVFNLLLQCMNFTAEIVVSICLAIFLLTIDFKMSLLIVGMLGVASVGIIKWIKPKLNEVGEVSRLEQSNLYKVILQSVSGIKEVKVTNKEGFFVSEYHEYAKRYGKSQIANNVISALPRLLIETVAIMAILIYLGMSIVTGVEMTNLIPLITAFGIAAVRLLPSVNRVNTYLANMSYYKSALDHIYSTIDMEQVRLQAKSDEVYTEQWVKDNITLEKEIVVDKIRYRYPQSERYIFDDAYMTIQSGKSVGIVGESGSGKTTIVDVLLGLLEVESGNIYSDGEDVFQNYASWLAHIGYIPQTVYMLDDSIRNNIAFGVETNLIKDERIWEVLEEAQLKEFVESLPDGLDEQIGERGVRISGGQRQRLGIARALYHNPELLIFDEATSALDNDTESAVMEAIESLQGQKTMVIIAHRLKTIENCDMIYEVKNGKIIQTK